ncbi:MAG TPA: hypothetical protein VIA18_14135, partial [Polyangia bacterium]|nr:hypothetical protein [Polyangia bacterium]
MVPGISFDLAKVGCDSPARQVYEFRHLGGVWMYRARIPLAAAALIAVITIFVLVSVRSTLAGSGDTEVQKRVERAQATWPSLDLLRGIDLTNETAKLARDEEFGAVFDKKGSDEERQAAFVAVSARNGRLEALGRKADLVAVVG